MDEVGFSFLSLMSMLMKILYLDSSKFLECLWGNRLESRAGDFVKIDECVLIKSIITYNQILYPEMAKPDLLKCFTLRMKGCFGNLKRSRE